MIVEELTVILKAKPVVFMSIAIEDRDVRLVERGMF